MNADNILIIDEAYGFKSTNHAQTRDGILFNLKLPFLETYILKPLQTDIEKKLFVYLIQTYLYQKGFTHTDTILLTKDNKLTVEINEQQYILSKVQKGRQCSAENIDDVMPAAKILANMHNCAEGFTEDTARSIASKVFSENDCTYIKNELGCLQDLFEHRSKELVRLKKVAMRRKNIFDYEYVAIADEYCELANEACMALKESEYGILCEKYLECGTICHKEYSPHNIVIFDDFDGGIINFDNASIDLPIFDVANLMKRYMKKNNWNSKIGVKIINEYCKIRELSADELNIIKIILSFPQKLWRVVNKYYNSRRSWCEKSCLIKLAEIKKENNDIQKFLKELTF